MCTAHVSAGCNLRDRDALEALLEEYKEGRAPCDLCSRLNWRCLLQAGQTLPNWPLWTAQRERRGKYVRGALRSLNSVLAMPSRRSTKPKMTRVNSHKSNSRVAGGPRTDPRDRLQKRARTRCSMLGGIPPRGQILCSRGLRPLGSTICKLRPQEEEDACHRFSKR